MEISGTTATELAAGALANIGALLGFFISLKVSIAKLEVKADKTKEDIDNIGQILRDIRRDLNV